MRFPVLSSLLLLSVVSGCVCSGPASAPRTAAAPAARVPAELGAQYAPDGVTVDGELNDPAWQTATEYELSFAGKTEPGKSAERGYVKLLWNEAFLYIGIRFEDRDVVAEGTKDQEYHYEFGDVAEVFLKPENRLYYWELYATPAGLKSVFFYPSRGRIGLPSTLPPEIPLRKFAAAARVNGTLNNPDDEDREWTAEFAVPLDELAQKGVALNSAEPWRILVARYSYSRFLPRMELLMAPRMIRPDFHMYEDYGRLKLEGRAALSEIAR